MKRVPMPPHSEDEAAASSSTPPVLGYGSYSALSMALGFLFLGHGERTFGRTPEAGKKTHIIFMKGVTILTYFTVEFEYFRVAYGY